MESHCALRTLAPAQGTWTSWPARTRELLFFSLADTLSARIWIGELSRELPNARIHGFDISDEQYPPENWYGPNVTLSKLDIFQPLPEELKGKYDVVHLRFFMAVAVDDNVKIVIENLKEMLSKYNLVLSYEYCRLTQCRAGWVSTVGRERLDVKVPREGREQR